MGWTYKGIFPAMQVPLRDDFTIDERELRNFTRWLAARQGICGLVTNGHTGEVFALTAKGRAEVTRIVAEEVKGTLPVISGLNVEGIAEAQEHAGLAKAAGAAALLVMPPHGWLRFGMKPQHVVDFFTAVGKACGLDLVVHVYPAWTRASYSSELLGELARLPWVKAFKVGTRDMNKYAVDIRAIREAAPDKTVLTCHDEYLLASMVQGRRRRAGRLRVLHPRQDRGALRSGQGRGSPAGDAATGGDQSAEGRRLWPGRAHRRCARAHEVRHVARRHLQVADRDASYSRARQRGGEGDRGGGAQGRNARQARRLTRGLQSTFAPVSRTTRAHLASSLFT
jgi:hypothetical protein